MADYSPGGILSRLARQEEATQKILAALEEAEDRERARIEATRLERKADRRFQVATVFGAASLVVSSVAVLGGYLG